MEEPSDSSRQRAPDLTTFLVTSYEHLRLKTPLISRIHRARFKLHKVHEVEISPVCRETMAKQQQEYHDKLLKEIQEKQEKAGQPKWSGPLFKVVSENPESNLGLLYSLQDVKPVEGGLLARYQKLSLDSPTALISMSLTHQIQPGGWELENPFLIHKHEIEIRKNGVLVLETTYLCRNPWIFIPPEPSAGQSQSLRRSFVKNFPPNYRLEYTREGIVATNLVSQVRGHVLLQSDNRSRLNGTRLEDNSLSFWNYSLIKSVKNDIPPPPDSLSKRRIHQMIICECSLFSIRMSRLAESVRQISRIKQNSQTQQESQVKYLVSKHTDYVREVYNTIGRRMESLTNEEALNMIRKYSRNKDFWKKWARFTSTVQSMKSIYEAVCEGTDTAKTMAFLISCYPTSGSCFKPNCLDQSKYDELFEAVKQDYLSAREKVKNNHAQHESWRKAKLSHLNAIKFDQLFDLLVAGQIFNLKYDTQIHNFYIRKQLKNVAKFRLVARANDLEPALLDCDPFQAFVVRDEIRFFRKTTCKLVAIQRIPDDAMVHPPYHPRPSFHNLAGNPRRGFASNMISLYNFKMNSALLSVTDKHLRRPQIPLWKLNLKDEQPNRPKTFIHNQRKLILICDRPQQLAQRILVVEKDGVTEGITLDVDDQGYAVLNGQKKKVAYEFTAATLLGQLEVKFGSVIPNFSQLKGSDTLWEHIILMGTTLMVSVTPKNSAKCYYFLLKWSFETHQFECAYNDYFVGDKLRPLLLPCGSWVFVVLKVVGESCQVFAVHPDRGLARKAQPSELKLHALEGGHTHPNLNPFMDPSTASVCRTTGGKLKISYFHKGTIDLEQFVGKSSKMGLAEYIVDL